MPTQNFSICTINWPHSTGMSTWLLHIINSMINNYILDHLIICVVESSVCFLVVFRSLCRSGCGLCSIRDNPGPLSILEHTQQHHSVACNKKNNTFSLINVTSTITSLLWTDLGIKLGVRSKAMGANIIIFRGREMFVSMKGREGLPRGHGYS